MPDDQAQPELVGTIAPASVDEVLSPVEANYLRLAKVDADRQFAEALGTIIRAHGHNDVDGRRYNFVDDDKGKLALRITSP